MTKTASSNSHLPQISDPGRLGRGLRQALARGLLTLLLVLPGALAAQDQAPRSPVLVVDFDEVFRLSQRGQEILEEFELRSRELADEIARIDLEMAAEEKALTDKRATLSATEFRKLADAFDDKVQALRAEQDQRAQALNRDQANARLEFRQTAFPILGQLMLDAGAVLVVEKRNVLVFNDAIDVSGLTAQLLDANYAERDAADQPAPDAPQETPARPEPAPDTGDAPEAAPVTPVTPGPEPE